MEVETDPGAVDLLELESWPCKSLDWLLGNRVPGPKVIGVGCGEKTTNRLALRPDISEDIAHVTLLR